MRGASNPTTPTANDHTEVCMLSAGQSNWSNEQQTVVAEAITSGEHRIMIPMRGAYTSLNRIMKRISKRTPVSQRCYAHDAERQPMLSISKSKLERESNNMNDTLGGRISELLEKQRLSQRELATIVGVTEVSMSRYINGERMPKGPVVAKIAEALHTTSDYLLGKEEAEDPELAYYQTQRAIARHAEEWTPKQKADLVNALFGA